MRQAVIGLVGIGAKASLAQWTNTAVGVVGSMIRSVLVVAVWRAVYGVRDLVDGVDLLSVTTYALLGTLIHALLNPNQISTLDKRLREGSIVFDMTRPVSLVVVVLAQQFGVVVSGVPKFVAGLLVGILFGGMGGPASFSAGLLFFALGIIGALVSQLINFCIALSAVWMTDVGFIATANRLLSAFCSGSFIPLLFMPEWLQTVLRVMPYSGQAYAPVAAYTGVTASGGLELFAQQVVWVIVLSGAAVLLWRRAIRRLVIYGG